MYRFGNKVLICRGEHVGKTGIFKSVNDNGIYEIMLSPRCTELYGKNEIQILPESGDMGYIRFHLSQIWEPEEWIFLADTDKMEIGEPLDLPIIVMDKNGNIKRARYFILKERKQNEDRSL